jgi:hypothetical protein
MGVQKRKVRVYERVRERERERKRDEKDWRHEREKEECMRSWEGKGGEREEI